MMKAVVASITALVALGAATSAWSFHFAPKESAFEAKGPFTLMVGSGTFSCTAKLGGTTVGKGASITSAKLNGATCASLTPFNLPWKLTIEDSNSVQFHDVAIGLTDSACGPGKVKAKLNAHGKITIDGDSLPMSGGAPCTVSATLDTTPNLTIEGN